MSAKTGARVAMPNVIAADVIHSAAVCSAKQNASMPAEPLTFRGSWVGSNGRFAVGQVIERQRDERHAKGAYCDGRARLPAESAGCASAAADGCGGVGLALDRSTLGIVTTMSLCRVRRD